MEQEIKIHIKPLSVNEAWQGKRFKTKAYHTFEKHLLLLLPRNIDLPLPPYQFEVTFGFSSMSSDWDNPIKTFQDVLQKKYKFNDKLIKRGVVEVVTVKKGFEFISFKITHYDSPIRI
jgi:Holliday junction resolvase RusA-like endonuclease